MLRQFYKIKKTRALGSNLFFVKKYAVVLVSSKKTLEQHIRKLRLTQLFITKAESYQVIIASILYQKVNNANI